MSFDKKIVEEVNKVRQNPKEYAEKLSKYLSYFSGRELKIPGRRAGIETQEGPKAYQEAIDYLSRQSPLKPLDPSRGLFKAAKDYLKIVHQNKVDIGSIDSNSIIQKYASACTGNVVSVSLGSDNVEQAVIYLLVGDGDRHRRYRKALLGSNVKLIGAANGYHPIYRQCTVIFTCETFESIFDENDIGYLDGYSAPKIRRQVGTKPATDAYKPLKTFTSKTNRVEYDPLRKSTKEVTTYKYEPATRYGPTRKYVPLPTTSTKGLTSYTSDSFQKKYLSGSINTSEQNTKPGLKVVSEKRMENYSIENGKRLQHVTIEKTMSDGTKQYDRFTNEI